MKRVLFIDRDGTLIVEPPDEQIDSLDKLEFLPGVISELGRIARSGIYELVLVTNQDGLGTDHFPENTFWPSHNKMLTTLKNEGISFQKGHIDRSFPHENKATRKPGIGMLSEYMTPDYDLANSFVIGDRLTDIQLAKNLGTKGILLGTEERQMEITASGLQEHCQLRTSSWEHIRSFVLGRTRSASVHRKTNETDIHIDLTLNASGNAKIETGLGFLDHMLDQLARHGNMDMHVSVKGDLHIDEHHTVEDTALALGAAFHEALLEKQGLARYGFCLPMDDCLAQVAVDFGGRPWLVWDAEFKREKIGEVPTEMFFHFFKSFSDSAKCTLNISATGTNEHHKIESIFKAFARAIRSAVSDDGTQSLPSTKGLL